MKVEWEIHKAVGRVRPVLCYKITFDQWETALMEKINAGDVYVEIPIIEKYRVKEKMRGIDREASDYRGHSTVIHNTPREDSVTLQYLSDDPEFYETMIREKFSQLIELHEAAVRHALSVPKIQAIEEMTESEAFRKDIAPVVASMKMKGEL